MSLILNDAAYISELKREALRFKSISLNQRQLCDLEMLLNGAFSPLTGFLNSTQYTGVCRESMLPEGSVWPVPVTLDVSPAFAETVEHGDKISLRDTQGVLLAVLTVEDVWQPEKAAEAECVFGTDDPAHPGVEYLLNKSAAVYLGGKVEGIEYPRHFDFEKLRYTPESLRREFKRRGWERVIAFQTRNPMHRAHYELVKLAAEKCSANILINPAVGMTKPGDVDHFTRVHCYQAIMPRFDNALLSLLPLAMRMAGPREALWHALIRKNYGCSHFIVGREHASPGKRAGGEPFYRQEDYNAYISKFRDQAGIEIVQSEELVYSESDKRYYLQSKLPAGAKAKNISGSELREILKKGRPLPEWFTFPEVEKELKKTYLPAEEQGKTIFLTGLPSSGKSTIAEILQVKLLEKGRRRVTLLDGDEVRRLLSSDLGFSKEHRDLNIRRIGFVASEVSKAGGIAICAPIAPYDAVRKEVRSMIQKHSDFILVFVDTPLEVCSQRDRKGLYAAAKAGLIKGLTGVDDPYEVPEDADLVINTVETSAEIAAVMILEAAGLN